MRVIEKIGAVVFVLALLLPAVGLADVPTVWLFDGGYDFFDSCAIATVITLLLLAALLAIRPLRRRIMRSVEAQMNLIVLLIMLWPCVVVVNLIFGGVICSKLGLTEFCQKWWPRDRHEQNTCDRCGRIIYRSESHCDCMPAWKEKWHDDIRHGETM